MNWWQWLLAVWVLFTVLFLLIAARRYQLTMAEEAAAVAKHGWSAWRWSQDGYVRQCKICKAIQYGGDDFDGGPDASGNVEA